MLKKLLEGERYGPGEASQAKQQINILRKWMKEAYNLISASRTSKDEAKLLKIERIYIRKILDKDFSLIIIKDVYDLTRSSIDEALKNNNLSKSEKAKKILEQVASQGTLLGSGFSTITKPKLIVEVIRILDTDKNIATSKLIEKVQRILRIQAAQEFGEFYHRDVGWY